MGCPVGNPRKGDACRQVKETSGRSSWNTTVQTLFAVYGEFRQLHQHQRREPMILVRNVHQLKFGKAKDMKAIWKEGLDALQKVGRTDTRAMLDVTGQAYTFVIENQFKSLAEFEQESGKAFA